MSPPEVADAVCPRCDGRGWVIEQDGGPGTANPCSCQRESVVPRLLSRAAIPPRFTGCSLDNFQVSDPDEGNKQRLMEALARCRRYVDGFLGEDGRFAEHGLLFSGPAGVGKTHLAVAVVRELVARYRIQALFTDSTALIHRLQSTFEPGGGSKQEVLDPVLGSELLVLDDVGAHKSSGWVNEILYLVLNERYARRAPTIVTTNLWLERTGDRPRSPDAAPPVRSALAERLPASLVSRLYEMTRPIRIEAGDFRREIKLHQHPA